MTMTKYRSYLIKAAAAVVGVLAIWFLDPSAPVLAQSQTMPPAHMDWWGPGAAERHMMGPGARQRMARHRTFMHGGVPAEYRGQTNPFTLSPDVVQAGGELYQSHCKVCHGVRGMGDGEAARALSPPPALLAHLIRMPISVDEYLMWSIAEGGKQFQTDMPAFKDTLTADEIWKIIAYMRAGFPAQ